LKIVIVAPRFPYPLDKGDRLTIFHMLRHFSRNHRLTLVCFLESGQDEAWVEKISPFCEKVVTIPHSKARAVANCALGVGGRNPLQVNYFSDARLRRAVTEIIEEDKPDILYAHTIRMGQYIEPYRNLPRVLAMQISMTLNYRRLAEQRQSLPMKLFHTLEYRKVRDYEGTYASQFDRVLLISPHDLAAIERDRPEGNVFFSPHGVDFEYFTASPDAQADFPSIIFTGNMAYAPNVDAANYFYHEIWPLIRQEVPGIRWRIVGADPSPSIQAMAADDDIEVTGRVPDLREYLQRATLAIDPLRVGAGLQNKVLEGMSMGLPMVITPIANEGINAVPGVNIAVEEAPEQFARAVVELTRDDSSRERMGRAARQFIVDNWSWEKHFDDLEEMFSVLVRDTVDSVCPVDGTLAGEAS
jgi:sugar transferase (PEP-CTERM/EpsH1 system associated)